MGGWGGGIPLGGGGGWWPRTREHMMQGFRARVSLSDCPALLGGSWVISRVLSRVTVVIAYTRGLMTPLKTTHEPLSIGLGLRG